jgi:CubicO group peptidase (beta-lactamase class C family)
MQDDGPMVEVARRRLLLRRWGRHILWALAVVVALLAVAAFVVWRAFYIDFETHEEAAIPRRAADFEEQVTARANGLLDSYGGKSGFAGVVLVRFGDRVRVRRAMGDVRDPEGRLTCGSLPKQMTGYAIHRLAQRGVLRLDDRLDAHLPELRGTPAGEPTIHQVLRMTSGLPGTIDVGTNLELQRHRDVWMPDGELLRRIRNYKLAFPPGGGWLYSNVGYRLLAMVAQRVTGTSWPSFLQLEVLDPAGMKSAGLFEPNLPSPPDLVVGRMPYRCGWIAGGPCMMQLPHWNYSALWGAGAVHLRGSDLLAWGSFLAKLRRDEPELFAEYTKVDRESYASGIRNRTLLSTEGEMVRVYTHTGQDPGYDAYFSWFPPSESSAADVTIVVLSNTDYGMTSNYSIGDELRALVAGQPHRRVN